MAVLAACTDAEVASPGTTTPVTIDIGGGTGGGAFFDGVPDDDCPTGSVLGTFDDGTTSVEACIIGNGGSSTLVDDLTLTSEDVFAINGTVFVGSDTGLAGGGDPASLTIPAGTVLIGQAGRDALVVARGSQIDIQGSPSQPVIFTSAVDLTDGSGDSAAARASDGSANGTTSRSQWGGLVVNGFAPINDCSAGGNVGGAVDCVKNGEGGSGLFGGDQPGDDSGSITYARVQYAGFAFSGDDELNGIALQGVGDATDISFVQVHNNGDDGVEFFGGTVDASYVVVTGADDDSIDWTDGWTGSVQYAVVIMPEDAAGNRAIEGDNRSSNPTNTPVSDPLITNFTLLGSETGSVALPNGDGKSDDGVKLRAGVAGVYANGIVTGFEQGVDYDDNGQPAGPPAFFSIFSGGNGVQADGDAAPLLAVSATNVTNATSTLDQLFPGVLEDITPTDPTQFDTAVDSALYVGAFDPATETPGSNWTTGWTIPGTLPFEDAGCPSGTVESAEAVPAGRTELRICEIATNFTEDTTLTAGNLYSLSGTRFIGEDAGGDPAAPNSGAAQVTVTINPGVTIFGSAGRDSLNVSRGSEIRALGTAAAPIVFTSRQDVEGSVTATSRSQWGGLNLNGRAPINDCAAGGNVGGAVDCVKNGEGGSGLFGGATADDDSGVLNYVRVQYAGFAFSGDDELNGIAFQGTGSGTDVDFIHVHNNGDDGVEFFGGATNASHIVISGADDDSVDWTDGWTGNLQYVIVVHPPSGDLAGNRGMEGDNRSSNPLNTPVSDPIIANFTLIGTETGSVSLPSGDGKSDDGMKLRAGTAGDYVNGIVTGFEQGIDYDDNGQPAGFPAITSILVTGNGTNLDGDAASLLVQTDINTAGPLTLSAPGGGITTGLIPDAATLAGTPAIDPSTLDPFFEPAAYVGAIEDASDDWYVGWTLPNSF